MTIHFNHLYLVLPERVYRTILTSDFLQTAFPGVERRVTKTAAGERWSGAYFYTRENYLEFFPSTAGFWEKEAADGWGGIAFSVDEPGGVAAIREQIKAAFGEEPFYTLRDLQVGDSTIHWFHYVRISERVGIDSFDSWVMEYTPEIFAFKGLSVPPSGHLTREAYLSQWNQPRPKKVGGSQPVFSKVIAATLRMERDHALRYGETLRLLGYAQSEVDGALVFQNDEMTLRFLDEEPRGSRYRVRSVELALARPMHAVSFIFAPGSRLDIKDDGTAEWLFGE